MEFVKKNLSLVLGISIPILMILFVAGSIYLPRIFIKPKFNFLYESGGEYCGSRQEYFVRNGRLVKNEMQKPKGQIYCLPEEIKLYIYDVGKDESREISFEEAQNLYLDSSIKSPDGFEVVYGKRNEGFFPFFFWTETDYNVRYLVGHNVSKKLNLRPNGAHHTNFRFIGWIIE